MSSQIVNTDAILQVAAQGRRLDGRALDQYRSPIEIETDISWTAEGSARVRIGQSVVLAGVKMSIEKTYNDTPDEGGIMINAELLPLSSPEYESGPPGEKAIELARVVDRGIREAKAIDMKKLCITPGEKAWFVTVDIITINDAGNLFDAAGLAALCALKAAFFPQVDQATGVIDYHAKTTTPLPLLKDPLPVTVYKIGGKFLVDPTVEEEKSADARLTIASDERGTISALQKGGDMPLTIDDVSTMVDIALEKASFLREQMARALRR